MSALPNFRHSRKKRQPPRIGRPLSRLRRALAPIEVLEPRFLLSGAVTLVQPLAAGTSYGYTFNTVNSDPATDVITTTVDGPAVLRGQNVVKVSEQITATTAHASVASTITDYEAYTATGLTLFEVDSTDSQGNTSTSSFSPGQLLYPSSMVPGTPYTSSTTETSVFTSTNGTTSNNVINISESDVLQPGGPVAVTVPAGTFMAYEIDVTTTTVNQTAGQTNTSVSQNFVVPGLGGVKSVSVGNAKVTPQLLTSFHATEAPAFARQPADVAVGAKMAPFTVDIEDGSGNIDTSSNAAVTLTLDTASGNPGATLGGAVTVNAVAGVATFSDLTVSRSGDYTLTASAAGIAGSATSDEFKVVADHFLFRKQPAPTDVDAPIGFIVEALTAADKIDTTYAGTVQINFNTLTGGENAALGGVTQLAFTGGLATFAGANAPTINSPGAYTLTASDGDPTDASATTSKPLTITGLHLVFTKEPRTGDIKAPLLFTVTVENARKKIQRTVNGEVTVSLNVVSGGAGAALTGDTSLSVVNGTAVYTAADDDAVAVPGTYTLTASGGGGGDAAPASARLATPEVFRADVPTNTFLQGVSKPFELDGFQLVFSKQPEPKTDVNAPIAFEVALEDKKRKIVTSDDGNFVDVSDLTQAGEGVGTPFKALAPYSPLENGIATFGDANGLTLDTPERYAIRITELSSVGSGPSQDVKVTTTNDGISKAFDVLPLHLVFIEQPPLLTFVNEPVPFKVAVVDYRKQIVTTEDANDIDISQAGLIGNSGQVGTILQRSEHIVDGVADFSAVTDVEFQQPGTYGLLVNEVSTALSTPGTITDVTYTKDAASRIFRISAG